MADGQIYTSKAAYRADLRARGLDEVGNDSSLYRDPTTDYRAVEMNVAEEAALYAQHVGA